MLKNSLTYEMFKEEAAPRAVDLIPVRQTAQREVPSPKAPKDLDTSACSIAGSTVLISDEHYKHSLGIVRHLGRMGARVSVVASSKDSLACRSRYCHEVILSHASTLEALVQTILKTVKYGHFDLVMPVSYPMTLALARRRDQLVPYTHLELVEGEAIELAANKVKMVDLAARLGVPTPKTFLSAEICNQLEELSFPVVIKPQRESPGHSPVRYAKDVGELRNILSGELERKKLRAEDYIVQEFVPGYGCGLFATYQNGVCKRVFMHRRIREYPATGGVSSCAESFYDAKLEFLGRRLLDALDWHGVAMVEFRRDSRDGEYKLMEINPKFWGSLDLALAAGADFPGDLCRMALGQTLSFSQDYQRNLRFQWPFSGHGDLFHLWTRPRSIFNVMLDFLNPRVKSNVWLGDFAPNASELFGLADQLFRARKE
jgi:predicted ATP-grasp superfamily ATP-dependent carboligase